MALTTLSIRRSEWHGRVSEPIPQFGSGNRSARNRPRARRREHDHGDTAADQSPIDDSYQLSRGGELICCGDARDARSQDGDAARDVETRRPQKALRTSQGNMEWTSGRWRFRANVTDGPAEEGRLSNPVKRRYRKESAPCGRRQPNKLSRPDRRLSSLIFAKPPCATAYPLQTDSG